MKQPDFAGYPFDTDFLFNILPGNYLIIAADTPRFTILQVTDNYLSNMALQRHELIGNSIFDTFPGNAGDFSESLNHVLLYKAQHAMADRVFERNPAGTGQRVWRPANKPVLDEQGSVQCIIHWIEEITEEARFRNMVEQAPIAMTLTRGQDMVVEIINPLMLRMMSQDLSTDVHGKKIIEILPEVEHQPVLDVVRRVLTTGEHIEANDVPVKFMRHGRLETRYLHLFYTPVAEAGVITSVMHMAIDETARVQARKKIEENELSLQLAIEIAELGNFSIDLETKTGCYTPRIREWFGLEGLQAPTDEIFGAILEADRHYVVEHIRASLVDLANSRHDLVYRVRDKQGTERYLRSFGKTFFDAEGKPTTISGIIQDVTAQIRYQHKIEDSEAALQQRVTQRTEELESLNKELLRSNEHLEAFTRIASHDLKEPVRKIQLLTELLRGMVQAETDSKEADLFNKIDKASARIRLLIEDLLMYAHVGELIKEPEAVDLNEQLAIVLEDLELEISQKQATVRAGTLPQVKGYPTQLQQLLQNLLGNALKYSREGVPPEINVFANNITIEGKPFHEIVLQDNGIGFEEQYAEQIFRLFVRLHGREEYSGTGVGLSIVKRIVDNHRGSINVQSEPGVGSTFRVLLPA